MINFPVALHSERFASVAFEMINVVSASRSAFTLKGQTQVFPGSIWAATVNYPQFTRATGGPIAGWLASLNGQAGSFLLGNPAQENPLGQANVVGSSPLVNGAAQTGLTLNIRSAPTSTVGWLLLGDLIQIGPSSRARLHVITANINTDTAGEAELDIWPALREPTLDGDPVSYRSPRGVFRLDTNRPGFDIRAPFRYSVSFPAVQV